jgi:hypothetical protein
VHLRPTLALLSALALTGCADMFGTDDPHQPGTPLGGFHVRATESLNTCGAGALGAGAAWEFDVHLSRDEGTIFWDNGAQSIAGTLADDGVSFAIQSDVVVDMRTEIDVGKPACSVSRHDTAEGVLDDAERVGGFAGTLGYAFEPQGDCTDLVDSSAPVFAALPCAMSFAMKGTLTEPPEE